MEGLTVFPDVEQQIGIVEESISLINFLENFLHSKIFRENGANEAFWQNDSNEPIYVLNPMTNK